MEMITLSNSIVERYTKDHKHVKYLYNDLDPNKRCLVSITITILYNERKVLSPIYEWKGFIESDVIVKLWNLKQPYTLEFSYLREVFIDNDRVNKYSDVAIIKSSQIEKIKIETIEYSDLDYVIDISNP